MNHVRFGVIGIGGMGGHHLSYMKELDGASLGGVCDVDKARCDRVAAQYHVSGFERYQDLLDSKLIDAVLIGTPHYFHTEIAEAALQRGLHVLCEKPIAVTVGAARKLNEAARKYPQLKFGAMFQMRTSPMYAKLRELIADGELGEITRVSWIVTDWFRTWTYYASGGWRATWAGEGGGVLLNQCPHNLDLIHWVTGLSPSCVTAVATIAKTHPIEVEDEVSAIIEFSNGAVGQFITTTGEAPGTNRLEIAGDRGKIVAENGALTFHQTRKSVREINQKSPESFAQVEAWSIDIPYRKTPEGHKVITQNFVRAVLKDEPLIAPGVDGVKGLELGNAMLMAGISRKPVDLPMDAEAYEAFLKELTRKYGGKKTLSTKATAQVDMDASFR